MNFVETIDDRVRVRHALVSVFDKRGLEQLVPALLAVNPQLRIYSTGGTFAKIAEILGEGAEGSLVQVSAYTGQPEMQGGLVKTLDFKIYLGLLSETYNQAHCADLKRVGAVELDLVVANLYPFGKTVARAGVSPEEARANIDIGGPCMIRAAAKNFLRAAAVVDPADYPQLIAELRSGGGTLSLETRFRLACKSFAYTAAYDAAIAGYLGERGFAEVRGAYREVRPGAGREGA